MQDSQPKPSRRGFFFGAVATGAVAAVAVALPGVQAPGAAVQEPKPAPQKTLDMEGKDPFAMAQMLYSRMLDEILTKSEDVGKKFPDEARKIYYKESPGRAIRGQATQAEHDELVDEGIPVARFPVPPADRLN